MMLSLLLGKSHLSFVLIEMLATRMVSRLTCIITCFNTIYCTHRIDTSQEMISMAQAISGHENGVKLAMLRHTVAIKKMLDEGFNAVVEVMSVIDTNPYPARRVATTASYRLGNAGELSVMIVLLLLDCESK